MLGHDSNTRLFANEHVDGVLGKSEYAQVLKGFFEMLQGSSDDLLERA